MVPPQQQQQWLETAQRLAALKGSPDCVPYCENAALAGRQDRWVSIYAVSSTAEVFVEVTDNRTTRVQSFASRFKNYPPELRRNDLPLVDTSDAHTLARELCKKWPTVG